MCSSDSTVLSLHFRRMSYCVSLRQFIIPKTTKEKKKLNWMEMAWKRKRFHNTRRVRCQFYFHNCFHPHPRVNELITIFSNIKPYSYNNYIVGVFYYLRLRKLFFFSQEMNFCFKFSTSRPKLYRTHSGLVWRTNGISRDFVTYHDFFGSRTVIQSNISYTYNSGICVEAILQISLVSNEL